MTDIIGFVVRRYFDESKVKRWRKGDRRGGQFAKQLGGGPSIPSGGTDEVVGTLFDKKERTKPKVSAVVRGVPTKRKKVEPPDDKADNLRAVLAKTKGTVKTGDVDLAALALSEGRQVELESTDRVSVLLDKLAAISKDAIEKGDKAPNYNLCDVTVKGTSLFCIDSKGIPRIQMPQLSGKPLPGSKAEAKGVNEKGEADLNPEFRAYLEKKGVTVTDEDVQASHLKATQNELNGGKVAGIFGAMKAGKIKDQRLFVSGDNYVVDGHHRWAAKVGSDALDGTLGNDTTMPVAKIDLDIIELLSEANKFAEEWGIPQAGVAQGGVKLADCGCLENLYFDPNQPRDREGKWRDVPGLPKGLVAEPTPEFPAGLVEVPGPSASLVPHTRRLPKGLVEEPTPRYPAGLEEVPGPESKFDRLAVPTRADARASALAALQHDRKVKATYDRLKKEGHPAGQDTRRLAHDLVMMEGFEDKLDRFRPVGAPPEGDIDIKTATDEQLAAKAAEEERRIAYWQGEIGKLHKRMKRIKKQGHRDDVARQSGSFRSVQIGAEYALRDIRAEQKNRAAPSLFV